MYIYMYYIIHIFLLVYDEFVRELELETVATRVKIILKKNSKVTMHFSPLSNCLEQPRKWWKRARRHVFNISTGKQKEIKIRFPFLKS